MIAAFSNIRTKELLYEIEQIIHLHGKRLAAKGISSKDLDIIVNSTLDMGCCHLIENGVYAP